MRPTRVEIDLEAIRANVRLACRLAGPQAAVLAVVKADAYGHGTIPVARAALAAGAGGLGVATPEEGVALREAGLRGRVLVLGPISPTQAELPSVFDLEQCVTDQAQTAALAEAGRRRGRPVGVHLKVDTGMGRVGVAPDEAPGVAAQVAACEWLRLVGLMTHFAEADGADPAFTAMQLSRFLEVGTRLRAAGVRVPIRHAANSAGLLYHPAARLELVRPGILLYGCPPGGVARPGDPALRPALTFRSAVSQLTALPAGASVGYGRSFVAPRPVVVATLPVGYADGLSRLLSNRGQVLIRGVRAPILGRICMDMTMVDVTAISGVAVGDEVVLIGRQGEEAIPADEHAAWQDTISYEVLCRIGPRVRREYVASESGAAPIVSA
jgi:alanine racemase